jgi:hypothetical protein
MACSPFHAIIATTSDEPKPPATEGAEDDILAAF